MFMEYTAEILRGWPADGARERTELVKQGSVLVNGDIVAVQPDGTVDKVGATASRRVGIVIRGNGDSGSAANALGKFPTPQPAKATTALAWAAGVVTATVANHGYATGNTVTIAGAVPAGYNGNFVVTVTGANTFTYQLAADPGAATTQGTSTLGAARSNAGKALVLWGNYIARVSNAAPGAYVPGSPVTAANGRFALGNGTTDPELGFVIRVQGATTTETAHIVVVAY